MRKRILTLCVLMMSCFANSGCVTLGPKVETRTVIYRPGKPGLILENVRVPVQQLETKYITHQDVGGWVTMPPEHWEAIERALKKETP